MISETIYENTDCWSAEDLLEAIDDGKKVIICNDPKISMVNGGNTLCSKDEEGYFIFSSGQNWWDQANTYISQERMLKRLQKALESVEADFNKYEYDTEDTDYACIQIVYPEY